MPGPRGRPKKGQLGKKAEIGKLIEAAQKAPSTSPKPQSLTASKRSPSKKSPGTVKFGLGPQQSILIDKSDDNKAPSSTARQAHHLQLGNGKTTFIDQSPKPAAVDANSALTLEEPREDQRTATIRIPGQPVKLFPTKKTIHYTQPALPTIPSPKPSRNPNHVILRLPAPQSEKEPTSFLSLAREIRNQIYKFALPRRKYLIHWIPRVDRHSTELTYCLPFSAFTGPYLKAQAGRLRRDFDLPKRNYIDKEIPRYRLSPGPAALLLVSKDVYRETAPMFYGRSTFSFNAMRPLGKFLDNLRAETRSMIRSLELIHITAGNAELAVNQVWKRKHDQRWESLCFQIRDQCTHLEDLTLDLHVKDLPFQLGPHACWVSPLYAFMGLDQLKHVDFRLHHVGANEAVLEVEAYSVRKALMGANFYEPTKHTGNEPLPERPRQLKARPGVNALRVTIGTGRVPASCIKPFLGSRATTFRTPPIPGACMKPSLGPRATNFWILPASASCTKPAIGHRATNFWTSPTPDCSADHKGKGEAIDGDHGKGKAKKEIKAPLTWTPPTTLNGTAFPFDNRGKGKARRYFGATLDRNLPMGGGKAVRNNDSAIQAVDNVVAAITTVAEGKQKGAQSVPAPIKSNEREKERVVYSVGMAMNRPEREAGKAAPDARPPLRDGFKRRRIPGKQ
ncbi:MAG: hypothetical protein Q9182_000643 [Xanthomendoza sp. 2 TL-2023]